jgi:hypothetical protein
MLPSDAGSGSLVAASKSAWVGENEREWHEQPSRCRRAARVDHAEERLQ